MKSRYATLIDTIIANFQTSRNSHTDETIYQEELKKQSVVYKYLLKITKLQRTYFYNDLETNKLELTHITLLFNRATLCFQQTGSITKLARSDRDALGEDSDQKFFVSDKQVTTLNGDAAGNANRRSFLDSNTFSNDLVFSIH